MKCGLVVENYLSFRNLISGKLKSQVVQFVGGQFDPTKLVRGNVKYPRDEAKRKTVLLYLLRKRHMSL